MEINFYPGFITYDFGDSNYFFVCVHPTTSLEILPREDIGADLLAVQLAQEMKGKAIIATLPREREFGMDFNRLPPSPKLAVDMFKYFLREGEKEKIKEYEERYAWTALSKNEHLKKKKIYNSFWSTVEKLSKKDTLFIFVHVQDTTLRNFPSLIDVIPLSGLNKKKIKSVIEELNDRYRSKFKSIRKDLTDFLIFDAKHQYRSIAMQTFGTLDPKAFSGDLKEKHEKMLKRIQDLGFKKLKKELKDSYTLGKHINAAKIIGRKIQPKITYMLNFTGKLAHATKKFLREVDGKGIELEVSSFLSEVYTDLGKEILKSFITKL